MYEVWSSSGVRTGDRITRVCVGVCYIRKFFCVTVKLPIAKQLLATVAGQIAARESYSHYHRKGHV